MERRRSLFRARAPALASEYFRSRIRVAVLALTAAQALVACGGAAAGSRASARGGADGGTRGIEAAALPFRVLRARGGQEISRETLVEELAAARAVCVGESHKNPHHHWVQLFLLRELSARAAKGGRALALGMEMFQRPFQGVVDDFAAGRIDEAALLERTGWAERWGYDFGLYRPMVFLARDSGLPILALNAPKELTRKVARHGLDQLTPEEKASLPELDLENAEHRAFFEEATQGHAMPEGGAENFYAAQVIWDETMAETAAAWARGGEDRQVVILAGLGHCHRAAIPQRLARRGVSPAVSVIPVIDDGRGRVADLLAKPQSDYLVVMSVPRR